MFKRILAIVAIVLLGLTAAFNLMGGIGTSCVAFRPNGFGPNMAVIAPYQWLYIGFVILGTVTGAWEAYAVYALVRRTPNAKRHALWSLIAGLGVAGVHTVASQLIRGASAPANMRVVLTAVALLAFLAASWSGAFDPREETSDEPEAAPAAPAAGAAMVAASLAFLSIQHLMRATHTIAGLNFADVWHTELLIVGVAGLVVGTCLIAAPFVAALTRPRLAEE